MASWHVPAAVATTELLDRCTSMEEAKQIHARMFKTGQASNTTAVSKLLVCCGSPTSGNFEYAKKVFDRFQGRANTLMWNTLIRGYANSNEPEPVFISQLWKRPGKSMARS
ncbi:Pentatricopeptide repeat-containing protein At5g66520 [Linum grandiflorum]